ncbi:MAG: class I SAM-dependent methyltransferase [Chloroflexi bacterium]|nr:class I SAM-dependent methyltransferase [Chloroflexota bacterium]
MQLFEIGHLTISDGAEQALAESGVSLDSLLEQHQRGIWPDEDKSGQQENRFRAEHGLLVMAQYAIADDNMLLIMTAADRSWTHVLLPHEFQRVEMSALEGYAYWAERYDRDPNPLIAAEEPVISQRLAAITPQYVLDAGTGTGRYAIALGKQGVSVVGIDQSPEMLALLLCHSQHLPVTLLRASLEAPLPFTDQQFDCVVSALVLSHLHDLTFTVSEFKRVLRPGGDCLISVFHPDAIAFGWRASVHAPGMILRMPNDSRTRNDYVETFNACDFSIAEVIDLRVRDTPPGYFPPAFHEQNNDLNFCLIIHAVSTK